ncbi:MAG: hypothetical protein HY921_04810 [Elusimicrobia bacterium]|nr:hypothetical protein [Elusimicrobiota bacterium]
MKSLALDFYGISLSVEADSSEILEPLRRDFEYFSAPGPTSDGREPAAIGIRLWLKAPPAHRLSDAGVPIFKTKEFLVKQRTSQRLISYCDQAWAFYDYRSRRGEIFCVRPERLHELAYLAALSRVGEELDRRGLHRIHALGFEHRGLGGLLLLPSGGGKSTMALEMLEREGFGILSDDTPLVDCAGRLRAFPLRLGFQPSADLSGLPARHVRQLTRRRYGVKKLVDLTYFRDKVRSDLPLSWLLIGRRGAAAPLLRPASWPMAIRALAVHLVLGHGVAQMAEYMLRPSPYGLSNLTGIALSRLKTARRILGQVRSYEFQLGNNPRRNLEALGEFLNNYSRSTSRNCLSAHSSTPSASGSLAPGNLSW